MKIKICGIRSLEDVDLMNQYEPDYIGFIFYEPSFRYINKQTAGQLKKRLDPKIKTVGVFVDEKAEKIKDLFNNNIIDVAQLHGQEDENFVKELKDHGIPVIKSFRIRDKESLSQLNKYDPDFFLFDVFSKKAVGGSGESFNWELLNNLEIDRPFFLAGGIAKDNINEALTTKAYALDISSGVETDRKKDKQKVKEIMEIFRKHEI